MDMHLRDNVILVAAASAGLGYGVAEAVAREGARVAICSRDAGRIAAAAAAARLADETGAEVVGRAADVRDAAQAVHWVEETAAQFGRIDGLVTNAGGPPVGAFDDFDDAVWQAAFELTLMSAVRLVRAALPSLRVRGGSVLMLTSITVKEPLDNLLLSNVMRAGVTGLAKSLSRTLAPDGIRVNTLMPGRIATERVAMLDRVTAEGQGSAPASRARSRWDATAPPTNSAAPPPSSSPMPRVISPASRWLWMAGCCGRSGRQPDSAPSAVAMVYSGGVGGAGVSMTIGVGGGSGRSVMMSTLESMRPGAMMTRLP
jgi:3-oxoacyl-[acyl-carrier protein] reductase